MNIFLTFSLRQIFYCIAALNAQNLKMSTLSPHQIKLINKACQTCQDESGLLKVLTAEDKKNEKFDSTEDLYSREKEGNVLKRNDIASQIGVSLEDKFDSKNVVNV